MFKTLKSKVTARFSTLALSEMYVVQMDKSELFDAYIAALPEAERAEHMCNCCRHFLHQYGNVVIIDGDTIKTVWEFETEAPYDAVPAALHKLILSKPISGLFLSTLGKLGTDTTRQRLENGDIIVWDHFYAALPKNKVIVSGDSVESIQGGFKGTRDVFKRSLETITIDSVENVLELIDQNTLYRGKESEPVLKSFLKHQKAYKKSNAKDLYVWANFKDVCGRIRNSAIGQLLVDLSEGKEVDRAVRSFESMVAPANYKRPTALVTTKMIEQAQATIVSLGIENSLARRHATKDDIPLQNLLYVNRDKVGVSAFDSMKAEVPVNIKSFARAKEMKLADFIKDVLPTATKMDVLVENNSAFMSLIAPVDAGSENMLAWDNQISWTYQNNMTDVIKEKVKSAGGSVNGELRISLEWFNHDDLDLWVTEPNGAQIYYCNKRSNTSDGSLDVDMNAGGGTTRTPVENVIFKDKRVMSEGEYTVHVNQFSKRENTDLGFNVQIECQGNVFDLSHDKVAMGKMQVATFKYTKAEGITGLQTTLSESSSQKEVNGVLTNRFQQVNMMMYSPNHWANEIGNKHLFFILDKAAVDNTLRPFFNEYLKGSLQEHRKVFEILGSKLMVPHSEQQLTGVGFSLTQQHQVIVRVNNGLVIKVNI